MIGSRPKFTRHAQMTGVGALNDAFNCLLFRLKAINSRTNAVRGLVGTSDLKLSTESGELCEPITSPDEINVRSEIRNHRRFANSSMKWVLAGWGFQPRKTPNTRKRHNVFILKLSCVRCLSWLLNSQVSEGVGPRREECLGRSSLGGFVALRNSRPLFCRLISGGFVLILLRRGFGLSGQTDTRNTTESRRASDV